MKWQVERISRPTRRGRTCCLGIAVMASVIAAGCVMDLDPGSEDGEEVGETSEAITITPIESVVVPIGHWNGTIATSPASVQRLGGAWYVRHVVAYHKGNSPWELGYFRVDATPSSANFGKLATSPTFTGCSPTCSALELTSTNLSGRAVFPHLRDPSGGLHGSVRVASMSIPYSGTPAYQYIDTSCQPIGGGSPKCRLNRIAAARSEGASPTIQVVYFKSPLNVDDYTLVAKRYTPGGAVASFPSLHIGPYGTQGILSNRPNLGIGYNEQTGQWLAVYSFWRTDGVYRIRGQIYESNGNLGLNIDLGLPPATDGDLGIGVASHPNPAINPSKTWVVFAGKERYDVSPNGTFTQTTVPPAHKSAGNPTAQWLDAGGKSYERLVDNNTILPQMEYQRFTQDPAIPGVLDYLETPSDSQHSESLVWSRAFSNSLAVWASDPYYLPGMCGADPTIACAVGIKWRYVDH